MIFLKKQSVFYWIVLPAFTILFVLGSGPAVQDVNSTNGHKASNMVTDPCPVEVEDTRSYMEGFLTTAEWERGRQESGTGHLTAAQITPLRSPEFTATCEALNNQFQGPINDTYESGGKQFEVTYFKVGNFYFVWFARQQPVDPDYAASGVEFVNILDENLEIVKSYFF